jgi:preprotein translocase subunit YajC
MTVPDFISPVVGFRVWQWDTTGLWSLNGEKWFVNQPLSAVCRADAISSIAGLSKATHNAAELPNFKCTCGVYAARTMEHLNQCGYQKFGVHGEVYLWGRVVEHEHGWRAEFAYPKSLFLLPTAIPFSLSAMDARLKTLTNFGTDIFIQQDHGHVLLWKNGSGYDAAGLDYLIRARRDHYLRRQSERTLKEGDRVAVLGHGIAVVEQVDAKEVHVALGNRLVLRIARQEIVVNEQTNRWECVEHPMFKDEYTRNRARGLGCQHPRFSQ